MGAKTWEKYVWEDLKIVPVPPLNEGRISVLDIFVQNGMAIRRRELVRIGSMVTLGNMEVEDWKERSKELSKQVRNLDGVTDDIVGDPFSRGFDGPNVYTALIDGNSKFLANAFGFADGNFGKSRTVEIQIRRPFHQRVEEDYLTDSIRGGHDRIPIWKPDVEKIANKERKSRSFWGTDKVLELWIVTELKFGSTVSHAFTESGAIGVDLKLPPGAEAAAVIAGLPVGGGLNASTSAVESAQMEGDQRNVLYGFKAVRVKFDEHGKYLSDRGMGNKQTKSTRAAPKSEFNPDNNPQHHMGSFIVGSGSGDEDHDGDFECVPIVFDENSEDETTP